MNAFLMIAGAVVIILFVWTWIGLVMVRHLNMARRLEKLYNIENPLPEEEREIEHLREVQTGEASRIRSAKWTLLLFMLIILGTLYYAVVNNTFRNLLGIDTVVQAIGIGVLIVAFFCMPTYLGLHLASFKVKKTRTVRVKEEPVAPRAPIAPPPEAAPPAEEANAAEA
jgi:hypothetical protein